MFDWLKTTKTTQPRKGMPSPELDEAEFKSRTAGKVTTHRGRVRGERR